jgi:hypothetical protein
MGSKGAKKKSLFTLSGSAWIQMATVSHTSRSWTAKATALALLSLAHTPSTH